MASLLHYFRQRVRGDGSHAHPKETEFRQKLKRELYDYNQSAVYGFPSKPSALCYDSELSLLAVATKSGALRIYGAPGVEFYGQHDSYEPTVTQMFFLPDGQGQLVTLTSDNVLHLWELNATRPNGSTALEETRSFTQFDSEASKQTTISACTALGSRQLLLGTEGGNIHLLDVATFSLLPDQIIYQDVVMHSVPDDFKVNPGAVEAIAKHPHLLHKFLIGYNRGLIVLWDGSTNKAERTFNATQQLEALSWNAAGTEFMSAHSDGSYITWSTDGSSKSADQPKTPYGPFPCKAITKIQWRTAAKESEDALVIFSGGLPRATYGDRHSVSVQQGADKHVTFDFTSRVIDFLTICWPDSSLGDVDFLEGSAHTLVVLLEEELVAIDLLSKGWPAFRLPYLNSLHSSAITATHHVANVPDSLWSKIVAAGNAQFSKFSLRSWPITGGEAVGSSRSSSSHDLLLTGHEDGSVRFWDASPTFGMSLLYRLDTASLFVEGYDSAAAEADDSGARAASDAASDDEDWPPFRKCGQFDPYSDDPRLGVQKLYMCPLSDMMAVAGTAGQIIVLQMERDERRQEVKAYGVNLVSDRESFIWKGHEALKLREGERTFSAGFQPQSVLQVTPPAACTALAVHSEWQLLAAGTAHGFALYDFRQRRVLTSKCTLGVVDTLAATDEGGMSRRKTFKQSLRESFRRLRRRRSVGKKGESIVTSGGGGSAASAAAAAGRVSDRQAAGDHGGGIRSTTSSAGHPGARSLGGGGGHVDDEGLLPSVERAVEARPAPQQTLGSSMVRVLTFADTFLLSATTHSASLWAGTNAGYIYVYVINLPTNDRRDSKEASAVLAKEVHLRHRAPIVSLALVDRNCYPLPSSALEVQNERARAPDMSGGHHLVVVSEEQFKMFALPLLKPEDKWKLTANEGTRVRKIGYVVFRSRSDENYCENDIVCLSNHGDFSVYTIRGLRRQLQKNVINITDVTAIATCIFTSTGQGFYQISSSECVRFSLSAATASLAQCSVKVNIPARPLPEVHNHKSSSHSGSKKGQDGSPVDGGSKSIVQSHEAEVAVAAAATLPATSGSGQANEDGSSYAASPSSRLTVDLSSQRQLEPKIVEEQEEEEGK